MITEEKYIEGIKIFQDMLRMNGKICFISPFQTKLAIGLLSELIAHRSKNLSASTLSLADQINNSNKILKEAFEW